MNPHQSALADLHRLTHEHDQTADYYRLVGLTRRESIERDHADRIRQAIRAIDGDEATVRSSAGLVTSRRVLETPR